MVGYGVAWHGMVWYGAIWYWLGALWFVIRCGIALHGLYCVVRAFFTLNRSFYPPGMIWHGMVWYDTTVWYDMVWYDMVFCVLFYCFYGMVWPGMVWFGMVAVWYGVESMELLWCPYLDPHGECNKSNTRCELYCDFPPSSVCFLGTYQYVWSIVTGYV